MCSAIDAILCAVCHGGVRADQIIVIRKTCRALHMITKPSFYNSGAWDGFWMVDSGPKEHVGCEFSFESYRRGFSFSFG